jgi:hypothetical protein
MDTMISLPTDSTADWRNLCCADKLRLYVLAWLAAYERFTTVANDAERKGKGHVPTFLCLTLSDGSLQALAGDYYAENIRHYLLLGDHAIDSTALYRLAAQRIVASLPAPERSRFNPRHAHYHGLIHQVEAELIRRDGEIFWLQNVNYPGLVMLAQNSFYGMREEQLRRRIDNQLQRLQQKAPHAVKLACTAVQPWLFQKPVMPAVMIPAATLARMPVLTL